MSLHRWRRGRLALGIVLAVTAAGARADVLAVTTPEHERSVAWYELTQRLNRNPKAFDRTDAACRGAQYNDACHVPANGFTGDGAGRCTTLADFVAERIDLVCSPHAEPTFERGLPAGQWQVDTFACAPNANFPCKPGDRRGRSVCSESLDLRIVADRGWQCTPPAMVADRFCAGRAAGAACTAEGSFAGQAVRAVGVCRKHDEVVVHQGEGVVARRPVLTCEAANGVSDERIEASLWRKLEMALRSN